MLSVPKAVFTIPRPARASLPALPFQLYDVPVQSRSIPAPKVSLSPGLSAQSEGVSASHRCYISASPMEDSRDRVSAASSRGHATPEKPALGREPRPAQEGVRLAEC